MKGATIGFGLFVVCILLGRPLPAQAQASTLKWADLVGTWEQIPITGELPTWEHAKPPIYHSLTFQPDSTVIMTNMLLAYHKGPDTLSMTLKRKVALTGDTMTVLKKVGGYFGWQSFVLHFHDQLLFKQYLCGQGEPGQPGSKLAICPNLGDTCCKYPWIYKRVDPSQRPSRHAVAAGFASGHPIPARPRTPTGTIADLAGAWEAIPTPNLEARWKEEGIIRVIRVFQSDSTVLNIDIRKDGNDTLAYGTAADTAWGWKGWTRLPGDSIIRRPRFDKDPKSKVVLQNQQLSFYYDGKLLEAFKPAELPKRP